MGDPSKMQAKSMNIQAKCKPNHWTSKQNPNQINGKVQAKHNPDAQFLWFGCVISTNMCMKSHRWCTNIYYYYYYWCNCASIIPFWHFLQNTMDSFQTWQKCLLTTQISIVCWWITQIYYTGVKTNQCERTKVSSLETIVRQIGSPRIGPSFIVGYVEYTGMIVWWYGYTKIV